MLSKFVTLIAAFQSFHGEKESNEFIARFTDIAINVKKIFSAPNRCRNPLHTNISMHILQTVLYTFLKVLTRRIC